MKTSLLLLVSFYLASCSATASGVLGSTLGTDGDSLPSDLSPLVESIRNSAFLSSVNRTWGAGPNFNNAAGNTLNAASGLSNLASTLVSDGGRTITVVTSDMGSTAFKFDSTKSVSEAFYTNQVDYPIPGGPTVSVVRTVGIKIDGASPALIWSGHGVNNPKPDDWKTVTSQETFNTFRDAHWTKDKVDFTNYYAYIGDTGANDSAFLGAVSKPWTTGLNASYPGGELTNISVTDGGRTINLSFSGGSRYTFVFDSAKSATEAYYRSSYNLKNLYPITRMVGIRLNAGSLDWQGYDPATFPAVTYDVALGNVNDNAAATAFNNSYHARKNVSFADAHKEANIGLP